MAYQLGNRVRETSTTTGIGTISLAGAQDGGYQTFVAGIGDTKTCTYVIVNDDESEWEVGIGTVSDASPDTLSRDTVLASSNAGAKVDFSAGTKDVFVDVEAGQLLHTDSTGAIYIGATAMTWGAGLIFAGTTAAVGAGDGISVSADAVSVKGASTLTDTFIPNWDNTNGFEDSPLSTDGTDVFLAADSTKFIQGAGSDFEQYYDGTDQIFNITTVGDFKFTGGGLTASQGVDSGEAFGASAVTGIRSTVVGNSASAPEGDGVANGFGADAGARSIAVGRSAVMGSGTGNIVIGYGSGVTNNRSYRCVIGYDNDIEGQGFPAATNFFAAGGNSQPYNDVYFGLGYANASPVGWTLHGVAGLGTDVAGGDLKAAPGQGTGDAVGGSYIIQVALAGASGSSLNALVDVIVVDGTRTTYIGDGGATNYAQFAADGELTLVGTARITKHALINNANLGKGATAATEIIIGNYTAWEFGIGDDAVFDWELPPDWAVGTDLTIGIHWYCDEAFAANSGEVQWRIRWSATPHDSTEAVDAPTHTGTIDYGDVNIPATAKFLRTSEGTISGASLATEDVMGFTIDRVALDDGSNPVAEPGIVHIEIEYIADKLGEAT